MKNKYKIIIILVSTLIFLSFFYQESKISLLVKRNLPSVVTIIALDPNDQPISLGSGFFINTNGDIVTNHHVLQGSAKAVIKTAGGKIGTISEIINDDSELDLVIAKTTLTGTTPLLLADSETVSVGDEIVSIGSQAGLEGTVSTGIISGIRKSGDLKFLQITAPISPGSSGGPVFNSAGKVIGVATAYLDVGQNLNFAMPANYLRSLKPCKIELGSLPKVVRGNETKDKETSLIRAFEIHYNYEGDTLFSLDFTLKNVSDYPIKNIELFFVYTNSLFSIVSYSTEIIGETILPHLALQFSHYHPVKYLRRWSTINNCYYEGEVELRILNYQIVRTGRRVP
jgi:hypothetical protein